MDIRAYQQLIQTAPGVQNLTSRFVSLEEMGTPVPVDWLIDGILPQRSLGVMYGQPGSYKSFLAIDWGLSLAYGSRWLGRSVESGGVVYVAAEGYYGMSSRIGAWRHHHNHFDNAPFWVYPQGVQFADADQVEGWCQSMTAQCSEPPRLVIIDTLARCMIGGDENSVRDVSLFIHGVNVMQRQFECAALIIHHPNKGGDIRGSTALFGAADTVVSVLVDNDVVKIFNTKQKDAEKFGLIKVTPVAAGDSVVLQEPLQFSQYGPPTRRIQPHIGEIDDEF